MSSEEYSEEEESEEEQGYSEEESEEEEDEEWTNDHLKLLYLISKYAKCSLAAEEKEGWIRKNSLLVLIYEGVVAGVFDYDYAPVSAMVGTKRVWLNISQEGKDDIDDVREGKLINGLKLSSEDLQPITAYQVSPKGLDILELVPDELKEQVDSFVHGPRDTPHQDELLNVEWGDEEENDDGEKEPGFALYTDGGYRRLSGITDTEDVSYVSSPYLPMVLRGSDEPTNDNTSRAHESAAGLSGIQDELSEAIQLDTVRIMVGEWIPFGSNQIVALNEKLGSADRCQGGMFTGSVDEDSGGTKLALPPGSTSVRILDYDETTFINFEAEINFPEDEGIIQVEEFGMHLNEDGTLVYGMRVDAIQDRKADDISLDMLSRLVVDVMQDSSQIADSLLSFYQKSLLTMVFLGDEAQRDKFAMFISDGIKPKLEASRYMDREDNENELKQVLGDTDAAYNLSPDDVLIVGRNGVLISGPGSRKHEDILITYLSLLSRDMFLRVFFTRVFVLQNELNKIRGMLAVSDQDPNTVRNVRDKLSVCGRVIIQLADLLGYLRESLMDIDPPPRPNDLMGKRLHKILDCSKMKTALYFRVEDMQGTVDGCQAELDNLTDMTSVINTKQQETVFKKIQKNCSLLVDASAAEERAGASLEVMEVIFSASMGFDIMYRMFGIDQSIDTSVAPWHVWIQENIVWVPGGWFCMNMYFTFLVCYALKKYMGYLGGLAEDFVQVSKELNLKCDIPALKSYLSKKTIEVSDGQTDGTGALSKTSWYETDEELWYGAPPKIEIQYDPVNCWLLSIRLDVDRKKLEVDDPGGMDEEEWAAHNFLEILKEEGVLGDGDGGRKALGAGLGEDDD